MNRENCRDFIKLYFSKPYLHADFDIICKGIGCFKHIPEDIDPEQYMNLLQVLIQKNGIFSYLRYFQDNHFALLCSVLHSITLQCIQKKDEKQNDRAEKSTDKFVVPDIVELSFLFDCDLRTNPDLILKYNQNRIVQFRKALDMLLTEKRYVSAKSFKAITLFKYTADKSTLLRAKNITRSFINDFPLSSQKLMLFLIALIALDENLQGTEHIEELIKLCNDDDFKRSISSAIFRLKNQRFHYKPF
ncbi:MAG: hypothetical protein JXR90_17095 [Spirochaetes bacterium]|nr:hypothetical protein [Spirochaetota bacterium]